MSASIRHSPGRYVGLAVISGVAVAMQSRVNATLAQHLGDAVLAAWVSFSTGLVVVCVALAVSPSARSALQRARGVRVPWWYLVGGFAGAAAVTSSAVVVPRVGVAAFTVVITSGQVVGGLIVDRLGLGPGGRRPVSASRMAAALLAMAAVGVAALGHEVTHGASPDGSGGASVPLILLFAASAGVAVSAQQAVNARLRQATGHALIATLANFVGGTLALTLVYVLVAALSGTNPVGDVPSEPWLYLGGPIGVAYIALNSIVVPVIGVLRQSVAVLVGMLSGAVLLDAVLPAAEMPSAFTTLLSVSLAALAVAVVAREQRSALDRAPLEVPAPLTSTPSGPPPAPGTLGSSERDQTSRDAGGSL